jgi:hypothetical protein
MEKFTNCKAPEAIPGLPKDIENTLSKKVEDLAEDVLFEDYCRSVGIDENSSVFPGRMFDGTQVFRDITGVNTQLFIAFLKENNPDLDEVLLAKQVRFGIKNPDWMTHRPRFGQFEFYEVKPNSDSGRTKGRAKILSLIALCGTEGLPYRPGSVYNPKEPFNQFNLWIETKGFFETEVVLHWFLKEPGLLLYEVCIDQRLRNPVANTALSAVGAAAAALMGVIVGSEGVPVPVVP